MASTTPPVLVLGGGVTGLALGAKLAQKQIPSVILEKTASSGGLARTLRLRQMTVDIGSHRVHEKYHPEAMALIRELIGDDLLIRPRRGRIWVHGKFVPYPPEPFDILNAAGMRKTAGFLADHILCALRKPQSHRTNYETYLTERIGKRLYEEFYQPYAIKLWGRNPASLESDPAEHRVKRFSPSRFLTKLLSPRREDQSYSYPRHGIGQITDALLARYLELGGRVICGAEIRSMVIQNGSIAKVRYEDAAGHTAQTLEIRSLASTIPLPALSRLIVSASPGLTQPEHRLEWRSLRLVFISLPEPPGGLNETFYVPDTRFRLGRVSEINLYSPDLNQTGRRVLTIEVPCSEDDEIWRMPGDEITRLCLDELWALGITATPHETRRVEAQDFRIPFVYPIYALNWREAFEKNYAPVRAVRNVYPVGRAALFLHCNIDHCIVMAHRLAEILAGPAPDADDWHHRMVPGFFDYKVRD